MIPLKLSLHNFLCYKDPDPLDFNGLHLACLSGSNGHGKSALLDAMTWALWGKARTNSADDLVHLGETDMWVDFEFGLGPNRYRVVRSRSRKGRGRSDLQLQIYAPAGDDSWHPITEPTLRATEARIVQLLRMDYETFVNSAYLVQGKADEFTVKPPNQRKQILADILGLALYDDLESRAKEHAREQRQSAGRTEALIGEIDVELANEPAYQRELEQAQQAMIDLQEELRSGDLALQTLRSQQQELSAQQRALADLERRIAQGKRELAATEEQLAQTDGALAHTRTILAQQDEIKAGYRQLQQARAANQSWNEKLARHAALQGDRSRLQSEIAQARSQIEAERRIADSRVAQLRGQAERAPQMEELLAGAQEKLAWIADLENQHAELQASVLALREEWTSLQGDIQRWEAETADLHEKLAMLGEADAPCPVCNRPLGHDERERVRDDYLAREKTLRDEIIVGRARQSVVKRDGEAAKDAQRKLEPSLHEKAHWQRQHGQAEDRLKEAREAAAELDAALAAVEQLDSQLAAGGYAVEAQAALARLDADIAALAYDADAHQAARDAVVEFSPFEQRQTELLTAQERAADLQTRIEQLQAGAQRWQETLAADEQQQAELAAVVAGLPEITQQIAQRSLDVRRLEEIANQARQRFGAARQRLETCRAQTERRVQLVDELEDTLARQAVYEELQAAFGKKGLQAMIIEAAIPEIESEANRLLNRMTDGRMAVRLETQRETKSTQEVRETLDIIISDELGSRDYSLFSGGEAFRANFAIRIALSKLLARRAGAALQTLIIDEGFGTQDAQGRERLVEAITSIQDDFERVLVITHIDELKDLFPARIEVRKTPDGSQISVN
ncbi:MAG: SMC family ATPase [Anaerolineae bacterium]|nr:SMC family ATPase [Anaerolineae bacterium]